MKPSLGNHIGMDFLGGLARWIFLKIEPLWKACLVRILDWIWVFVEILERNGNGKTPCLLIVLWVWSIKQFCLRKIYLWCFVFIFVFYDTEDRFCLVVLPLVVILCNPVPFVFSEVRSKVFGISNFDHSCPFWRSAGRCFDIHLVTLVYPKPKHQLVS